MTGLEETFKDMLIQVLLVYLIMTLEKPLGPEQHSEFATITIITKGLLVVDYFAMSFTYFLTDFQG